MVMAIRWHALSRPANQIDLNLVGLCDMYVLGGDIEVDISRKKAIWNRLMLIITERRAREIKQPTWCRYRPIPVILVALLIAMLLFCAAMAAGLLPWKLTISWDKDALSAHIESVNAVSPEIIRKPDKEVYGNEFVEVLDTLDTYPVLPTWLPARFNLVAVEKWEEANASSTITALYSDGNHNITIVVFKPGGEEVCNNQWQEISGDIIEIITRDSIEFYLYTNKERKGIRWYKHPYQVTVSGNLAEEDLKYIAETIIIEDGG
jgi:hypothetical protein